MGENWEIFFLLPLSFLCFEFVLIVVLLSFFLIERLQNKNNQETPIIVPRHPTSLTDICPTLCPFGEKPSSFLLCHKTEKQQGK